MQTRYPYRPIKERADYSWPEGKRLAVYIALNVESYTFGGGMIEELLPSAPQPDILNYAWCDYGNRIGVWRILELLEELHLPVTLLVNSRLYGEAPQIMAAFRKRGDEIACHGRTNSERQGGLSRDEESALIHEATQTMIQKEGRHPGGWLSPWISETYETPVAMTSRCGSRPLPAHFSPCLIRRRSMTVRASLADWSALPISPA
jgi:peptidoglycan/xylan/chitin deacetylase (PgdA/CDA1 family)